MESESCKCFRGEGTSKAAGWGGSDLGLSSQFTKSRPFSIAADSAHIQGEAG